MWLRSTRGRLDHQLRSIFSFGPHERIRTAADYQRVKQGGRRTRTAHYSINFMPNDFGHHRLGLVVQKRLFWRATDRNRLKRCVREWFRLHKHQIPHSGLDMVLIARQGAERLSFHETARELLAAFIKQDDRSS